MTSKTIVKPARLTNDMRYTFVAEWKAPRTPTQDTTP